MSRYSAFISYRKTSETVADLVIKSLVEEHGFSVDEIFLDKNNIGPEYFDIKLKKAIAESKCLILIVTKDCFIPKADDEDWFIEEIKTAIYNNITIIPLLFDGIKSLKSSDIQVQLKKSFASHEIDKLVKYQAVPYHFELSDSTFEKLASFVRQSDKPGFKTLFFRTMAVVAVVVSILAVVFTSFFGAGFLWGSVTTGDTFNDILIDNTHLDGSTAVFEFCGLHAEYNLDLDTVCINIEDFDGTFPQSNYENFASSCSVSGALLLFNKNMKNLKYIKYLKGGSKHSKLIAAGITATVFAGSFCGFSQGCKMGKINKQRENVLLFYKSLKDKHIWAPVFADNILFRLKYNAKNLVNVFVWCSPSSMQSVARDSGLTERSLLLKYNNWEIGRGTYPSLTREIDASRNISKDVVILKIDTVNHTNEIKHLSLPSGMVGIEFLAPISANDISYAVGLYNEWKCANH